VAVSLLLDTNAYAALMRGHPEVARRVRGASQILLSTVVAGELLFGFRNGTRFERNLRDLNALVENHYVRVVPVSLTTADRFARIAAALRKKGTPLPSNDIWIAAQALETGADLLTFDGHFAAIDGLALIHLGG
jgi:tRNA(fMet)-specific endonuclease VapC